MSDRSQRGGRLSDLHSRGAGRAPSAPQPGDDRPGPLRYDVPGRRIQLTLPNQVATTYQYDPAARLTTLGYQNAGGPLGDLSYTYDAPDNRKTAIPLESFH